MDLGALLAFAAVLGVACARRAFASPRLRRWVNCTTGTAMAGAAVAVATRS